MPSVSAYLLPAAAGQRMRRSSLDDEHSAVTHILKALCAVVTTGGRLRATALHIWVVEVVVVGRHVDCRLGEARRLRRRTAAMRWMLGEASGRAMGRGVSRAAASVCRYGSLSVGVVVMARGGGWKELQRRLRFRERLRRR